MAVEVILMRSASGALVPFDKSSAETLERIARGRPVKAVITQPRNPRFHRKGFAMLGLAFDLWSETLEAQEYYGREVRPDFDRFRADLLVSAGFCSPVFRVDGSVEMKPESMSFANMAEERFEAVYSGLLTVVFEKVLPNIDPDDFNRAVDKMIGFA